MTDAEWHTTYFRCLGVYMAGTVIERVDRRGQPGARPQLPDAVQRASRTHRLPAARVPCRMVAGASVLDTANAKDPFGQKSYAAGGNLSARRPFDGTAHRHARRTAALHYRRGRHGARAATQPPGAAKHARPQQAARRQPQRSTRTLRAPATVAQPAHPAGDSSRSRPSTRLTATCFAPHDNLGRRLQGRVRLETMGIRRRHEMPFGAELVEGGVRFRLWAPGAPSVALQAVRRRRSPRPTDEAQWAMAGTSSSPTPRTRAPATSLRIDRRHRSSRPRRTRQRRHRRREHRRRRAQLRVAQRALARPPVARSGHL